MKQLISPPHRILLAQSLPVIGLEAKKYVKIPDFAELVKTQVISSIQIPQFHWPLRVYYEDTDAGGMVYHSNYLKYFERARTEWLRQIGVNQQAMISQQQVMFVMKSALVDYHLPAKLDDELIVITDIEKSGRASVVFSQEAWRGDQCLVGGRFKIGCVHAETVRPCAIPPEILNAMRLK